MENVNGYRYALVDELGFKCKKCGDRVHPIWEKFELTDGRSRKIVLKRCDKCNLLLMKRNDYKIIKDKNLNLVKISIDKSGESETSRFEKQQLHKMIHFFESIPVDDFYKIGDCYEGMFIFTYGRSYYNTCGSVKCNVSVKIPASLSNGKTTRINGDNFKVFYTDLSQFSRKREFAPSFNISFEISEQKIFALRNGSSNDNKFVFTEGDFSLEVEIVSNDYYGNASKNIITEDDNAKLREGWNIAHAISVGCRN